MLKLVFMNQKPGVNRLRKLMLVNVEMLREISEMLLRFSAVIQSQMKLLLL